MGLNDRPEDKPTSDVRHLWDDAPAPGPAKPPGVRPPADPADIESIELAEVETPRVKREIPTFGEAGGTSRPKVAPDRSGRIESARDFPLWSRYQESGPALFRVFMAAGSTFVLAWIFADWNTIHISGWIAFLGTIGSILLAYPLVVGLERPVRSSPERVVRDFLESLEHHRPLYRRMWLLLTPEARETAHYTEFSGFRAYWNGRIQEWRHRGGAWPGTPVVMSVNGLHTSHDSAEPLIRHMKFDLAVSLRGRRSAGPVASYKMQWTVERGRDGQWYLHQADPPG